MQITLPEKVKSIIQTLEDGGYEAYAVGGCVRDSLLGRTPEDWDITTSAKPEEIKRFFRRTVDTGIQHGTVTIMLGNDGFEVTTYRIDGDYEDSRHPKEVTFTSNLLEDLKRRDFTINAMAYNENKGLVDAFDGMKDLENQIIRAVGNPNERFEEDALRILRAIRFSAQLGYTIEAETLEAIKSLAPTLQNISAERIRVELVKLLISPHPERLWTAYDTGVTKVILPEFDQMMQMPQNNPHHMYTVGEHTIRTISAIEPDKTLRLTMLFHDSGKPHTMTKDEEQIYHFYGHERVSEELAEKIMRRLTFDNDTIRKVRRLVLYHDYMPKLTPAKVRNAIHEIGEDIFPLLFPVKRADIAAKSEYKRQEKLQYVDDLEALYQSIMAAGDCLSLKSLAVSGKDLIAAGMKPGKELGETLEQLLKDVLEHPEHNTKEYLLKSVTTS
ncbi:MAG TPA: CCA tRNA nucleotidyltransferase [Lachnospiraceae bacterium]|nr:CCA tRNA nucleotidyltransferase [Lachnospiraceae bacterium]